MQQAPFLFFYSTTEWLWDPKILNKTSTLLFCFFTSTAVGSVRQEVQIYFLFHIAVIKQADMVFWRHVWMEISYFHLFIILLFFRPFHKMRLPGVFSLLIWFLFCQETQIVNMKLSECVTVYVCLWTSLNEWTAHSPQQRRDFICQSSGKGRQRKGLPKDRGVNLWSDSVFKNFLFCEWQTCCLAC